VEDADGAALPAQLETVLLQQLLRELPPKVRDVYLLCRVAGLTYGEVAQRCGISVKRVEARMTEAHRRFAALMRD
jgi:RNA polymerase sigma-70 factor (ECF subfamily)